MSARNNDGLEHFVLSEVAGRLLKTTTTMTEYNDGMDAARAVLRDTSTANYVGADGVVDHAAFAAHVLVLLGLTEEI